MIGLMTPDVAQTPRQIGHSSDIMQRCYPSRLLQSTVYIAYLPKFSEMTGRGPRGGNRPRRGSWHGLVVPTFERAGLDARGRRPDRDRSRRGANRSLVLGAILSGNPERARRTASRRLGAGRSWSTRGRPSVLEGTSRQSLHGSTSPPPLGAGASDTLCPMIRASVKNAEDPGRWPDRQARTTRPDPPRTPRVAFLVSTTSGECPTIQPQS
jgi:hypothetical protein